MIAIVGRLAERAAEHVDHLELLVSRDLFNRINGFNFVASQGEILQVAEVLQRVEVFIL